MSWSHMIWNWCELPPWPVFFIHYTTFIYFHFYAVIFSIHCMSAALWTSLNSPLVIKEICLILKCKHKQLQTTRLLCSDNMRLIAKVLCLIFWSELLCYMLKSKRKENERDNLKHGAIGAAGRWLGKGRGEGWAGLWLRLLKAFWLKASVLKHNFKFSQHSNTDGNWMEGRNLFVACLEKNKWKYMLQRNISLKKKRILNIIVLSKGLGRSFIRNYHRPIPPLFIYPSVKQFPGDHVRRQHRDFHFHGVERSPAPQQVSGRSVGARRLLSFQFYYCLREWGRYWRSLTLFF